MTDWQPIKTAPKNEVILIAFYYQGNYDVAAGLHWLGDEWSVRDQYYEGSVKPTHWRPLPAPPPGDDQ